MSRYLYVYILKCTDGLYYTGVTNDPAKRLAEHNFGNNPNAFTFSRRPVEMVFCERYTDFNLAIDWEKRIKDWSRKKKEALINGEFDLLKEYAACKNETSHTLLDSARSDNDSQRNDNESEPSTLT